MKKILVILFITAILFSCASKSGNDIKSVDIDNAVSSTVVNNSESSRASVSDNTSTSSEGEITITENKTNVFSINWYLIEVYIDGTDTQFRRFNQPNVNIDLFTLNMGDLINGVGAPNRYTAPYTTSNDGSISIGNIASTLMAALFEPVNLREHDFFTYIKNASRWQTANDNLELLSKTENGRDVRLVFSVNK